MYIFRYEVLAEATPAINSPLARLFSFCFRLFDRPIVMAETTSVHAQECAGLDLA